MAPKDDPHQMLVRLEALEGALLGTLANRGRGLISTQEELVNRIDGEEGLGGRLKVLETAYHKQRLAARWRAGWLAGAAAMAGGAGGGLFWVLQKLLGGPNLPP